MKVVLMRRLKKGEKVAAFINELNSKWFVADAFEEQKEFPFTTIGDAEGESFSLDREYLFQGYRVRKKGDSDEVELAIAEQQLQLPGNGESYTVLLKLDIPNDLEYREFEKDGRTDKVVYLNGSVRELVNSRKLIFLRNNDAWREEALLGELREWVDGDDATQIQSVLCHALRDFRTSFDEMTEEDKRRKIREIQSILDFGKNPRPGEAYNYADMQQYYLMRYGYMYVLKYYMMYTKLLQTQSDFFSQEGIRVLSLGCGAKLDGMGMKMAIEKEMPECMYRYTGVDRSEWDRYGYDFRINENDFNQSDIIAYLDSPKELNQNVYIFPTSISEFDDAGLLEGIVDKIKQKVTSDYIYVMADMRYNSKYKEDPVDRARIERVKERLVNSNEFNRFELVGTPIEVNNDSLDDKHWKNELEKEYTKRYHAVSIIKDINDFLSKKTKEFQEDNDKSAEGQNPIKQHYVMHYNEQVNFCIMKFRKIK